MMDVEAHFRSLTQELEALRDRVRNLLGDSPAPHWLTDGEWKESVLRTTLKRHLPRNIEPVRGFVVTENGCSSQIDVILFDNSQPVLFREGDLVFATPDAVIGIIEVKTNIRSLSELGSLLAQLADNIAFVRTADSGWEDMIGGLFSYQTDIRTGDAEGILDQLSLASQGSRKRIIDFLSLGCSLFGKYWEQPPDSGLLSTTVYDHWHVYDLENLSAGYCLSNLVYRVSLSVEDNKKLWFPQISQEEKLLGRKLFEDAT